MHSVACGGTGTGAGPDSSPDGPLDGCPELVLTDDGSRLTYSAGVRVVDENRAPIANATVDLGAETLTTDACGVALLENRNDPVVAVIRGNGFLDEPVVIGHADNGATIEVRLWSHGGGTRWVMHSGGDVMLARRYEQPEDGTDPLLPPDDIAGGARHVVAPIARAFAAADLRTINLETAVGTLPLDDAYPRKRLIIQTKPDALAALQDLEVDIALLANNHIRDYLDIGITQTIQALEAAEISHVGASDGAEGSKRADEPLIMDIAGLRVGTLAFTTIDGTPVNDEYARDGAPVPPGTSADDLWQYEPRVWGFEGPTWSVPVAGRRIGSVWQLFRSVEARLSQAEAAEAWASLIATYPELQDWVARRGHGGASLWTDAKAMADIAALDSQVDMVVVQLHAGLEYQTSPSRRAASNARLAIDAGADIVIIHHSHTVQGAEWYKGKLIAHGLGNFIFEQYYEATTPTAFLRTVWDGTELIEARMVLIDLDRHRPHPLADSLALRHARLLWEKSANPVYSDYDVQGTVRSLISELNPDVTLASVRMHHGSAAFSSTPIPESVNITIPAYGVMPLTYPGLINARVTGADIYVGRDLIGWGGFEDVFADGTLRHDGHWILGPEGASIEVGEQAASGLGYLSLRRSAQDAQEAFVRSLSRFSIPANRLFYDNGGEYIPADGEATYSVRMQVRKQGTCAPYVFLDFYQGEEWISAQRLGAATLPIQAAADGQWHEIELLIPLEALVSGPMRAGAVAVQVRSGLPAQGECVVDVDDLRLVDWRSGREMPGIYGAFDYIRNATDRELRVTLEGLSPGE